MNIFASFTRKAQLSGPLATPFCTGLAGKAYNPMYKARHRPYAQLSKFKYCTVLGDFHVYLYACLSKISYYIFFQQLLMNRRGSMFLFSLLYCSERMEGSLAYKFAMGMMVRSMDTNMRRLEWHLAGKSTATNEKLSCETLSNFLLKR